MTLSVVRFRDDRWRCRWGVVRGGEAHAVPGDFPTTGALLGEGRAAVQRTAEAGSDERFPLDVVLTPERLCSPITARQQVICQAVNYRAHAVEAGLGPQGLGANVFFCKAGSCLTSARSAIPRPPSVRLLDYEIELGLVVGRRIDAPVEVTWANLHEHLAGVVMIDDVSARDTQVREGQFWKSKSYRGFGPTGPFLCLLDRGEIARLPELELTLRVDGELRQRGLAGDMIHDPPATLTELSSVMDLDPGDLIATGTPSGVALRVPRPPIPALAGLLPARLRQALFVRGQARSGRYLEPGATVEATIRTPDGAIDLGEQACRVIHSASPRAG